MSGAVIIGYDQTLAGERALALAADEAALRGVPLQIVNIVRPGDGRRPTEAANALAEWIVEEGERAAHEAHPELLIEKHVAVGRPDEVLTDEAHAAEMLVLGDRSHRDRSPAGGCGHGARAGSGDLPGPGAEPGRALASAPDHRGGRYERACR
jgi:nucleotide-binding universal stress UspA family protein